MAVPSEVGQSDTLRRVYQSRCDRGGTAHAHKQSLDESSRLPRREHALRRRQAERQEGLGPVAGEAEVEGVALARAYVLNPPTSKAVWCGALRALCEVRAAQTHRI